ARRQYDGSVTYYKKEFLGGDHDLKAGGEITDEYSGQDNPSRPSELGGGDFTQQFQNGVPFQVVENNTPTSSRVKMTPRRISVKDNGKWGDRLTLNLGLRGERYHVWIPQQTKEAGQFAVLYPAVRFAEKEVYDFRAIAPRAGAAYALTRDGKTALKVTWGK